VATAVPERYPRAVASLNDGVTRLVHARLETAHARIAAALRPPLAEFDLVRGLTGLGAYLLRQAPDSHLFDRVLTYLVRLTEPLTAADDAGLNAPGWWTNDIPSRSPDPSLRGGHANLGMAHGIAGPLALLALAMRQGVTVDGHADAIDRICRWMDGWRQEGPAGAWWPEWVTLDELRTGRSAQGGPRRPSWCYGTPGLARAQQLAGIALADHARQDEAEHALTRCLADPTQLAHVIDPALCHGWAGLLATAWCAAADARSGNIAAHLPHLTGALLGHASEASPLHQPGLIEGSAGAALTLHSIATSSTGHWLTCLLLN